MNSFRFLERGVNAEIERQIALLEAGEPVVQETLHFDPATGRLSPLRSKEEAHDYRYFPEPDLVPLVPTEEMLEAARDALPELPAGARAARYERDWGARRRRRAPARLRAAVGRLLRGASRPPATAPTGAPAANWVDASCARGSAPRPTRARRRSTPEALAQLVGLVGAKTVTAGAARQVLDRARRGAAATRPRSSSARASARWAAATSSPASSPRRSPPTPGAAEKVRGGNAKAMGPIVGFVMRETKGRADGGEVGRLIREQLGV